MRQAVPPTSTIHSTDNNEVSAFASTLPHHARKRRLIVEEDDEEEEPTENDHRSSPPALASHEPPIEQNATIDQIDLFDQAAPSYAREPSTTRDDLDVSDFNDPDLPDDIDASLDELFRDGRPNLEALPDSFKILLHFGRGEPLGNLRSIRDWPTPTWIHKKEDGYGVLLGRITDHITALKAKKQEYRGLEWPTRVPYVQPTNSSKQKSFQPTNESDYEKVLAHAWHAERKRLGGEEGVIVKIFVYLKDNGAKSSSTLQRASQKRIEEANRLINRARAAGDLPQVGKFTQAMLSRDMASANNQSQDGQPIVVPDNPVYRQAARLDQKAAEVSSARREAAREAREITTIGFQMYGNQWVRIPIDIAELRRALGLPRFDITDLDERPMDPPPRPSPDMEDFDHHEDPFQ
ncbi:hypothetical protein BGX28_000426 [Mortierella sp. GBA30]|nr:hypothetical protein BGX28_000426 [Mortierella sp. GBA30]